MFCCPVYGQLKPPFPTESATFTNSSTSLPLSHLHLRIKSQPLTAVAWAKFVHLHPVDGLRLVPLHPGFSCCSFHICVILRALIGHPCSQNLQDSFSCPCNRCHHKHQKGKLFLKSSFPLSPSANGIENNL